MSSFFVLKIKKERGKPRKSGEGYDEAEAE
jgi:hypothetical protein